ncbi:hypothetical protein D3C79_718870 [compost metagenome]
MVGCRVSWFSQVMVPGLAKRSSTRLLKALMPRAMKKIIRAMTNPGMALTMASRT